MSEWKIKETANGLRLASSSGRRRALGSDHFTWAHLLYGKLGLVQVYVIYYPSRFNLPVDTTAIQALETFGKNTGPNTSVNVWDTTDPDFNKALLFFDVKSPPALVLATGLQIVGIEPYGPDKANLYTITIADPEVLSSSDKLTRAVNQTHDILVRGNPKEITSYVRSNALHSLLMVIAKIANVVTDEFVKLKPRFQLPDGSSIQLGG